MKSRQSVLLLGENGIGAIEILGNDMPWVYGSFLPLPAFERVAPLFRLLQDALDGNADPEGEDGDLHLEVLEQVNRLGLVVKHPNGKVENIRDFKIEETRFEYKTDPNRPTEVTLIIGPEYDTHLFERLRKFVADEKGSIAERQYFLAGSQEVAVYSIVLPGGAVEAVSETYVGLSLRGPADLVAHIKTAMRVA